MQEGVRGVVAGSRVPIQRPPTLSQQPPLIEVTQGEFGHRMVPPRLLVERSKLHGSRIRRCGFRCAQLPHQRIASHVMSDGILGLEPLQSLEYVQRLFVPIRVAQRGSVVQKDFRVHRRQSSRHGQQSAPPDEIVSRALQKSGEKQSLHVSRVFTQQLP